MKNGWLHLLVVILLAGLVSACTGPTAAPAIGAPAALAATATPAPAAAQTLTVFAAASLTDVFTEIGAAFEAANPGITVRFNFAGSQGLRAQLEQGAQADVFAPANQKEMDALLAGKLVADGTSQVFLGNQLVVVVPASNPGGLNGLPDLANSGVKLVLAAQEVPAGGYTFQALDKLNAVLGSDYQDRVLANVVSYENDVKQVLAKVQLGEADAGIVYTSDTVAAPTLLKIEIPAERNVIASYPIAPLAQSPNPALAQAFIDYVLSTEGQDLLVKWGFMPVK